MKMKILHTWTLKLESTVGSEVFTENTFHHHVTVQQCPFDRGRSIGYAYIVCTFAQGDAKQVVMMEHEHVREGIPECLEDGSLSNCKLVAGSTSICEPIMVAFPIIKSHLCRTTCAGLEDLEQTLPLKPKDELTYISGADQSKKGERI